MSKAGVKPTKVDGRVKERARRAGLKARLLSEGRWQQFLARREALKEEGLAPVEAHRQAEGEFPALNSSEMMIEEVFAVGELDDIDAEATRSRNGLEGEGRVAAGLGEGSDGEGSPPLLCKDDFEEKERVTFLEIVEWVFNHIELGDTKPQDAPCAGAWAWLVRVRENPQIRAGFFGQVLQKLIPSKAEQAMESRFRDDGRKVIKLIDRIRKARDNALLSVSAEELHGESQVPA